MILCCPNAAAFAPFYQKVWEWQCRFSWICSKRFRSYTKNEGLGRRKWLLISISGLFKLACLFDSIVVSKKHKTMSGHYLVWRSFGFHRLLNDNMSKVCNAQFRPSCKLSKWNDALFFISSIRLNYQWRKIRNSFACFAWILFLLCSLFMSTF